MIRGKVYGEKIIYIIWGVLFFFLFYSFSWVDILATTEHGMNLWTCLFGGGIYQAFICIMINTEKCRVLCGN